MKRVICMLLVALLMLFFSACGGSVPASIPAAVSSTSNSNTNISSVPTENPVSSVPNSIPPATSESTPEISSDGYPVLPWYQEGDDLIAYAESLGYTLYQFEGGAEEHSDLTFIYGGESNQDPNTRAIVEYRRMENRPESYLFVSYNSADFSYRYWLSVWIGECMWEGDNSNFPDDLAVDMAIFLRNLRGSVDRDNPAYSLAEYKSYPSWYFEERVDGEAHIQEDNWPH